MTRLLIFIAFALFCICGFFLLDPDLGWHITVGSYILKGGIPIGDPFSYTMPSYTWVYHEWLQDVFLALAWPVFGKFWLSIIYSIFSITSLLVVIGLPRQRITKILFLLSSSALMPSLGVRPQVVSFLFTSTFIKIYFDKKLYGKYKFFLPILFLLWANLHGSFAYGILLFVILTTVKSWKLGRVLFQDCFIAIASLALTLINPYGIKLWQIVISHQFLDTSLRKSVLEWGPAIMSLNFSYFFLLAFSLIFAIRLWKYLSLEKVVMFFIVTYLSFTTIKHIPLFTIAAPVLLVDAISIFKKQELINSIAKARYIVAEKILFIIVILVSIVNVVATVRSSLSLTEKSFYPVNAVEYIKSTNIEGNIFSTYNWGGYLIWKLPEKKVFADGRMSIWENKNAPNDELVSAFSTYKTMFADGSFEDVLKKFNIKFALIEKNEQRPNSIDKLIPTNITKLLTDVDLTSKIRSFEDAGWIKIYEDHNSVIYSSPNN